MMGLGMPAFFDIDERLAALSAKGDDLERINGIVDFELFRPQLEAAVPRADRAKGGRPAFDHVLMFKSLILQAMHSLSDERCEYLIKDRLSFMRFLGLGIGGYQRRCIRSAIPASAKRKQGSPHAPPSLGCP
jgi:IS5 family transposase